ncbi:hypothetical protein CRUP_013156 [Coryphaenoides rupestris]|nr:hypothetical protein CRUP_013156 [Coryphaenoides rupestris]
MKIRACQGSCRSRLSFTLQEEDYLDLLDQMDLQGSPLAPPPRRELPDITAQGQRNRPGPFGNIEEHQLMLPGVFSLCESRLEVGNYEGDAGDGLASHSGRVFSSFDRDQEGCAARDGGGWWQHRCPATNLNGLYGRGADRPNGGVVWAAYRPAHYSLKRVRMSIRPAAF